MPQGHGVDVSYFAMMAYISGQVISEGHFFCKVISTFHTPCLVNKHLRRDTLRLCKSLFSSYLPWNLVSLSRSCLQQSPLCYLPNAIFPSFLLPHLLIGFPLQEKAVTSAPLIYLISYYLYQYCSNYFNPGHWELLQGSYVLLATRLYFSGFTQSARICCWSCSANC